MQTKQKEPEAIIIDLETTPSTGTFWATGGLYDKNIIEETEKAQILSVSYKKRGSNKTYVLAQCDTKGYKKGVLNDYELVKFCVELLDKADIVIGQNSIKFDIRFINTRAIILGIKPPSLFQTYDTIKMASIFMFPSKSLSYMLEALGLGGKMAHSGFLTMYKGCLAGDAKYWNELKKYNKQDVVKTEELFEKLLPWYSRAKPTWKTRKMCPRCGGDNTQSRGTQVVQGKEFKRHFCKDCALDDDTVSGWFNGDQVINKLK